MGAVYNDGAPGVRVKSQIASIMEIGCSVSPPWRKPNWDSVRMLCLSRRVRMRFEMVLDTSLYVVSRRLMARKRLWSLTRGLITPCRRAGGIDPPNIGVVSSRSQSWR